MVYRFFVATLQDAEVLGLWTDVSGV
jgi:hypothetical protein